MFWTWLRDRVKQTVLAGISDAVTEINGDVADDAGEAVAALRLTWQPPEPAAEIARKGKVRANA